MQKIRAGKDFWSGIMFIAFAAVGFCLGRNYAIGSAGEMGPGFFPVMLSLILAGLGLILVARAVMTGDHPIRSFTLWPLLWLVLGVIAFGFAITKLGLVICVLMTVGFAALAGRESGFVESIILASALAGLSLGIFHYALRLPLPLWPAF
jgi:hypothetical protein